MKEEVKALWKLCFEDNEKFTNLYFSMRYKDEINVAIKENGEVISALQMIPYPMTYCNRIIPTSYISGACTHPDFRVKGVMKHLLAEAFQKMYDNKVLLTTLIPAEEWLFAYYNKVGYTLAFDYSTELVDTETLSSSEKFNIICDNDFNPEVFNYFSHKMMERPVCLQHTEEDFNVILADLKLEGGKLFIAQTDSDICGLVICISEGKTLHVMELFAEQDSIKNTLLSCAAKKTHATKIRLIVPPCSKDCKGLGMARIINAEEMLRIYAATYPKLDINFNLVDPIIEANNGHFNINHGIVKRIFTKQSDVTINEVTVQKLTQALLGYKTAELAGKLNSFANENPYMSLMLN